MMLRPIAETPFADRQIEELQFAERIVFQRIES
jgi:hypothetical protein